MRVLTTTLAISILLFGCRKLDSSVNKTNIDPTLMKSDKVAFETNSVIPVRTALSSSSLLPVTYLYDNNVSTFWSSIKRTSINSIEWAGIMFNGFHNVNYLGLYPRYLNNSALSFPVKFDIYYSDGTNWHLTRSDTAFPNPSRGPIILKLPTTVNCDGIGIYATVLGRDNNNDPFFQLAELYAGYELGFENINLVGNNGIQSRFEFRNVGASSFDPLKSSNWNFDVRVPFISPNPGPERNIYAPFSVYNNGSWNIYFGGMDGSATRNDRISLTVTSDNFLTFGAHTLSISNGTMIHANNPSALKKADNDWLMFYTVLPSYATPRKNRIAYSVSSNGTTWTPNQASSSSYITMAGYPNWANADLNGSNVIYNENGVYHLYFTDLNSGQIKIHYATSSNAIDFIYQGVVINAPFIAQDLKKFIFNGVSYYVLTMHANTNQLGYSIGTSPSSFSAPSTLLQNSGLFDQYITSGCMVAANNRLFGILYGAGSVPTLDQNAIYASWLQKKVVFENEFVRWDLSKAYGPDRVIVTTTTNLETGRFFVYDSDGTTLLYTSPLVTVRKGDIWNYLP